MSGARKALVLSPEPPYPLAGGGALRTASLLHLLAQRMEVDLALFAVKGAGDPAGALPAGLARDICSLPLPAHARSLPARLWRNGWRLLQGVPPLLDRFAGQSKPLAAWLAGRRYDFCLIEHFWAAPYLDTLRPHCDFVALDLHNVESEWHRRVGAQGGPAWKWGHRRFAACYRERERQWLPRFDLVLTPSKREAALLPPATRRVAIYPNAIPWREAPPRPATSSRPPRVVFSGNLEYTPNQQAIRWFAREVWPRLLSRQPDWEWRIVGKHPEAIRGLLAGAPRAVCTGPVRDAVAALADADIAIAPILSGSGTRVKIVEAWAARLPVVATNVGAEGLEAVPGTHLLLADSPASFAASLTELLADAARRDFLARNGRRLYEEKYTWDAAWALLSKEIPGFSE